MEEEDEDDQLDLVGDLDPNLTLEGTAPPERPLNLTIVLTKLIRYPKTQKETIVTVLLGIASMYVLIYLIGACYGCMCSRNYDKWRASWARKKRRNRQAMYYKQIREAVPLILEGHLQVCDFEFITVFHWDGPGGRVIPLLRE